jgi:beta-glucosidase
MTAFNDLNGVPSTANSFLLRQILRAEWKFDGLVVSDYTSVKELINHGLAANDREAAMYSLNAGTDMEMVSRTFNQHGAELVKSSKVSMKTIDDAVRNVLRVKFRLGLFDNPYADERRERQRSKNRNFYRQHTKPRQVVCFAEKRTRNFADQQTVKKIAVVGALADDKANTLDWWAGDAKAEDSVTILQGIRDKIGASAKILSKRAAN